MNLATVISKQENFIYYARVMIHSLKASGFDRARYPLYIFTDGLLKEDEAFLRKLWNVKFIKVDKVKYKTNKKESPKFWALEAFNPDHYKKRENILFLDADLIITQDITGIKKYFTGISMMRERGRACFNSGVVCINKKYITKKLYNEMIGFPMNWKEFGHDQQILNKVFNKTISELPKKYNMFVGFRDEFNEVKEAKIIHYIHKPDRKESESIIGTKYMNIWKEYHKGMLNEKN
jgi:lipopolysaccharide biosynthesis glycosyltransferase